MQFLCMGIGSLTQIKLADCASIKAIWALVPIHKHACCSAQLESFLLAAGLLPGTASVLLCDVGCMMLSNRAGRLGAAACWVLAANLMLKKLQRRLAAQAYNCIGCTALHYQTVSHL